MPSVPIGRNIGREILKKVNPGAVKQYNTVLRIKTISFYSVTLRTGGELQIKRDNDGKPTVWLAGKKPSIGTYLKIWRDRP